MCNFEILKREKISWRPCNNGYVTSTQQKKGQWLFKPLPWKLQWDITAWMLLKHYATLLNPYQFSDQIRAVLCTNWLNSPSNLKTPYNQKPVHPQSCVPIEIELHDFGSTHACICTYVYACICTYVYVCAQVCIWDQQSHINESISRIMKN